MTELLEIFGKLEFLKEKPGFYIAFVCILAFLFRLKIIFEFVDSLYGFFDKVSQRKYLKYREMYEDSLTNNTNKNIAKTKIDSFHFEKLYGIYADEKLRVKLIELASYSQDEKIWRYIRSSRRYFEIDERGLLKIRLENLLEILWRYFLYILAATSFLFTLLCVWLLVFQNLDFKFLIFITFLMVIFYILTILILFQTSYAYSLKKIKQIRKSRTKIKLINKNETLKTSKGRK
jgi:hypothetical protein